MRQANLRGSASTPMLPSAAAVPYRHTPVPPQNSRRPHTTRPAAVSQSGQPARHRRTDPAPPLAAAAAAAAARAAAFSAAIRRRAGPSEEARTGPVGQATSGGSPGSAAALTRRISAPS
ncbi:hypothetical protein [Streptomyces sp. NPDC001530]|uniref:hypothetical protein n=1 Tax=Streptomyces sp. NPDC001530 TaxID=3364582 RepID=UPI0036C3FABE